jgi:hypothetical protein
LPSHRFVFAGQDVERAGERVGNLFVLVPPAAHVVKPAAQEHGLARPTAATGVSLPVGAADSRCPLATGTCAMSIASLLRSPIAGDPAPGAQDGAQDILRGIGLRASGDRVGVRQVEIAEADAVVSYLSVVCCLL